MKKIAIIAAENKEMLALKKIMTNIKENKIYNLTILDGEIENKECVLVEAGIGKVNAGRVAQILIDKYDIEFVINIGSAGGINPELDLMDIVIGKDLVQYDYDLTPAGRKIGEIPDLGVKISSSESLVEKTESVIKGLKYNNKVLVGTIATADIFCTDPNKAKEVRDMFNAECVEMEGAAIAHVCILCDIPFVVIRSISDSPKGDNRMDFEKYLDIVSMRCAEILKELLKEI